MSKKGFTLVELLGTIVIIALISVLIVPRIVNWYSNSTDSYEELNDELIIEAARIYIDEHQEDRENIKNGTVPVFYISMQQMINYGCLDEKNVKKVSKENLESARVRVTYNGNYFEYYLEK